jgi:cytochrome c553
VKAAAEPNLRLRHKEDVTRRIMPVRSIAAAIAAAGLLMTAGGLAFAAGDPAAGRQKALHCQACHGLDGLSKLPEAPHLAGQPAPYLVKALNDYRHGVRKHDMMTIVVAPLTDQDVADLAAYYAAIEITATPPK